jgi:hypothetical protein
VTTEFAMGIIISLMILALLTAVVVVWNSRPAQSEQSWNWGCLGFIVLGVLFWAFVIRFLIVSL